MNYTDLCVFVHLFFSYISLVLSFEFYMYRRNDELQKDAVDALCCLAQALGEDFTVFIPSIHKLLLKHRLRVFLLSDNINLFIMSI